jgi:membrane associated rhomboid family serine protease
MTSTPNTSNSSKCTNHPDRMASSICAHCDRPICTDCMQHAPVGWQCPDCIAAGAKQTKVIRPFAPGAANRTGVVGSTNPTPVVLSLVAICVVAFLASGFGKTSVINRLGMWPDGVHYLHQYYRLFTSLFLHLDVLHIAFNMISLLIVGPAVEVMLGKGRFLTLFLLAGLGGNVLSYLIAPENQVSAGASGAIFGVFGAYVVLARIRRQPMGPVVALIVINLVIGFTGNVEWQAHVGGLITGSVLALAYHYASLARPAARALAYAIGASALVFALLALLVLSIAPGHVNVS